LDAVWRHGIAQTACLDVSKLAKQHIDDPDVPAAPSGADGYAEWAQIALILFRVELGKKSSQD